MVRDRDQASDLTQDTLVRVIEGLPGFDGRSALSTWVIRIAMNGCLSHLRKARIRRHASLEGSGSAVARPIRGREELSGAERVEYDEEALRLLDALECLDPETRAILVLRDLQELEYARIGEVLGIAVGTVKSRLFRARAALREAMRTMETSEDS